MGELKESAALVCRYVRELSEEHYGFKSEKAESLRKVVSRFQNAIVATGVIPSNWRPKYGIGQGNLAQVMWVVFRPPGQELQDGVYVGACFGRTGNGFVIGCMKSASPKSRYGNIETVIRYPKGGPQPDIFIDGRREETWFNNVFLTPLDMRENQIDEHLIVEHMKKSVIKCQETLANYVPKADADENLGEVGKRESRCWVFSPGRQASRWDEQVTNGFMALSFEGTSDLTTHDSIESIRVECQSLAGDEASHKNAVRALVDFKSEMKEGDLVFAKRGMKEFVGVGRVTGEYYFEDSAPDFKHRRAVEWFKVQDCTIADRVPMKTLTDITSYPDVVLKLAKGYGLSEVSEKCRVQILNQFREKWPRSRLQKMELPQYHKLQDQNSFCYWLEARTENLGSIWGGSAYKFGIFEFDKTNHKGLAGDIGVAGNDEYRWYAKYGQTQQEVFSAVRSRIVQIADLASQGKLEEVEAIDFSPAVKWKIFFLYQDFDHPSVVPIFKKEWLANVSGLDVKSHTAAEMYAKLVSEKPTGMGIFAYYDMLMVKHPQVTDNGDGPNVGTEAMDYMQIGELDKAKLTEFLAQLSAAGLQYDEAFVRRFFAAVQAKQFVVLTGLSGSGKTQLAIQFCAFIAKGRHAIVSVGADWTNNEKMLGYLDAVNCGKYVRPESGVLDLVLKASRDSDRPYVLVLDEMNLSHVERYFADFLSAMESKGDLKLHGGKESVDGVPPTVKMPENLWVIGTMNVDETTYMFSPKVLDRAQVLEFRVKAEDMKAFLDGKQAAAAETLNGFFPELAKVGAEFGYRTAGEFCSYVEKAIALGSPIDEAVDTAIMQKLLPKLHGSRRQLERPLEALWKLCLKPDVAASVETLAKAEGEIDVFPYGNNCKYPISGEKIARIYKNAKNNGFASYAEA